MALSRREKNIFKAAYKLGFKNSFDGWNGETFLETDNILYDGGKFNAKLDKELQDYELESKEHANSGATNPFNYISTK